MQDAQDGGAFTPCTAVSHEEHGIHVIRIHASLGEQLPSGCALHRCETQHALPIMSQQKLDGPAAQQAVRIVDNDHSRPTVVRSR